MEDPGDDECWDPQADRTHLGRGVPKEDDFGNPFITIVDSSGIHHLPILLCDCEHAASARLTDCLRLGYFPTSFHKISTLFTTKCLDDFRLSNLECKTTPYQYYNYLRRKMNPAFPKSVPDRYAELRRLSRQWRIMKRELWAGIHCRPSPAENTDSTSAASTNLTIFCPTCPQPSVNLPANWRETVNQ